MCGRYCLLDEGDCGELSRFLADVDRRYKHAPEYIAVKWGEIFPANIAPVIALGETGTARPFLMQWGFTRAGDSRRIINARSETVHEKTTFRRAVATNRCLVPAAHYFEWDKKSEEREKYAIKVAGEPMIYMAGIFRYEESPDIPVFAILTKPATPSVACIHDRMPVILPKTVHEKWLSASTGVDEVLQKAVEDLVCQKVCLSG